MSLASSGLKKSYLSLWEVTIVIGMTGAVSLWFWYHGQWGPRMVPQTLLTLAVHLRWCCSRMLVEWGSVERCGRNEGQVWRSSLGNILENNPVTLGPWILGLFSCIPTTHSSLNIIRRQQLRIDQICLLGTMELCLIKEPQGELNTTVLGLWPNPKPRASSVDLSSNY